MVYTYVHGEGQVIMYISKYQVRGTLTLAMFEKIVTHHGF